MPKQLNVNMSFTADTSQARKRIQDLQATLDNLISGSIKGNIGQKMDADLQEAITSAKQLRDMIAEASNTKTGNLDLSKFSQQIEKSGRSVQQYARDLSTLGPEGSQAFMQLAQSVAAAEVPMKKTFGILDQFKVTLANAARWQISSSVLHGFMGAIQGAYGYAQDLNKSLTDIRIVTGQSTDEMARFAEQANKSAQALSTSTLAYTDAALIYYQQGLDADAVAARTETTLKMSNVTGESAEEVSSYMTAIWNNFYDGSQSIESFADKITALGAATASSSREIAGGLQQFAAIANTVGLSYDYAATALATIVARTRQSESTVGNGLRTVFARLSSLKQGGTEDGVDLTKYTKALQQVGINVLDQNGQLKEMDSILDDIGEKWQSLNKNQQVALAQTVGGVRQYATIMALFDDWDQFQKNLAISENAEGTLEEQSERFEESWLGAQKRVQAAWQAIYQDLIDDKFFIGLLDNIAKLLQGLDSIIDSIGGLKGVLPAVGALLTTIFAKDLANGIEIAVHNFKVFTGQAEDDANRVAAAFRDAGYELAKNLSDQGFEAQAKGLKDQIDFTLKLRENAASITEENRKWLLSLNEITKEYANAWAEAEKLKEIAETNQANVASRARDIVADSVDNSGEKIKAREDVSKALNIENFNSTIEEFKSNQGGLGTISEDIQNTLKQGSLSFREYANSLRAINASTNPAIDYQVGLRDAIDNTIRVLESSHPSDEEKIATLKELAKIFQEAKDSSTSLNEYLRDDAVTAAKELALNYQLTEEQTKKLIEAFKQAADGAVELSERTKEADQAQANYNLRLKEAQIEFEQAKQKVSSYANQIVSTARALTQLISGFTALGKAWDTLTNKDLKLTPLERIQKSIPSILMGLPMVISGFQNLAKEGTFTGDALAKVSAIFMKGYADAGTLAGGIGALTKSFAAFLPKLLTFLGWAALAVAAIVAIKVAWDSWYATTDEGKLEASNKRLEELKEKADEAAQAYDKLTSTLEEYHKVQEEINDMAPGLEKTSAVLDENEKILDFIEENNLWDTINENGGLQYDSSGLIKLTEVQEKAISNDLVREKSLQKQAEYQEKINNLQLQANVDYKKEYNGPKLKLDRTEEIPIYDPSEGKFTGESRKEIYGNQDSTRDFIKLLNKAGLGTDASRDDIEKAIEKYASEDEKEDYTAQLDEIMSWLSKMAEHPEEFNQLKQDETTLEQTQKAYQQQYAQSAIGQQVYETTDNTLARQGLFDTFIQLGSDWQEKIQQGIQESGLSLAEAFRDAGVDVAQMIAEAEQIQREDLTNKIADNGANRGDINVREDVENWVNGLSEDKLKIAAELDIDYDDTLEDVQQKLEDKINNTPIELDTNGLTKKQAEELQEEFEQLTDYITRNAEEIDGLDDHLANCAREASVVARAILRFDDAIQDVTEHYDEWNQALTSGSTQSAAKAAAELQDAYGNLMDIDGSQLSNEFLESTKNLDLMKQAINGNEEAYNQLLAATGEDIIAHLELDPTDMAAFQSQLEVVKGLMSDFPSLDVGANLDTGNFLDELTTLVNAAGMTAEQATAYLASMGIDAEVTKVPAETEPVTETHNYWIPAQYEPDFVDVGGDELGVKGRFQYYKYSSGGEWSKPEPASHEEESAPTAFTLKVTSAHKSSGGSFKHKNATHGGGGVSPSKGKSGGGGGKGGGSPKKKTVKEHAKKEKVEDRYHNIKSAIDAVSKSLQRLNKLQDRAYGKSKLKYMDQEIDKLKEQVKLTDQYIKEAKQYLALDRKNLEGTGMGAIFDTDGRLVNYEQVLQKMVESYNKAVDKYNGSVDAFNVGAQEDADNEALENAKKQLDKAKEVYDDNKKILDQYEKTYQELQTQVDKKVELLNEIYDKKLAKVVWKVDIQLEVNDADIKYLEWLNKQLEKSSGHATDILANLSKAALDTEKDIAAVNQGLVELFSNHGIQLDFDHLDPAQLVSKLREFMAKEGLGSELTEEEAKQIRDWNDKLMEYIDNWVNYWEEAHKKIDETFKDYNDKIDKEIDKLEEFTDILDHYNKIIDLTGAQLGMSDEDVLRIHDAKIRNGENELRALRAEREEVSALLQEAQTNLANAETEEAKKLWEGHVQEIENRLNELDRNIRSQWENVLDWAQDRFDKALEAAAKSYEDRFDNLTLLMDRFDRQKEADHLFLDDYEKYHELNKDAKELEKMIDNTNNTLMRSKYADYLDKVRGYMASGVKLSQAQADLIAKRVELLKAEDDLLNARNAKNMVRMTRDNEGNFSYTYTADQDAIDDAELGYNDAFYNLQKSTRDYQEETQGDFLNRINTFMTTSQELVKQRESGEITPEQYAQAMTELQDQYQQYMQWYLEQMGFFYDEEGTLRDEDLANLEEILGLKLADYDDFITEYEDSILGRLFDDVDSEYEFVENAIGAEEQLLADNTEAAQQWEYDIQEICAAAGVEVDKFRETVLTDLANIDQKSIETKEKITEMSKKMKEDMDEIMKKALQMDQDWANRMQSMRNQIAATVLAMNTMLAMLANVTDYAYQAGQAALYAAGAFSQLGAEAGAAAEQVNALANALGNAAAAASAFNGGGGGGSTYQTPPASTVVGKHMTSIYGGPNRGKVAKWDELNGDFFIDDGVRSADWYKYTNKYLDWFKNEASRNTKKVMALLGYSTGGYTGAWGPEGRLALLHEKELVLNKEDTANILNVVDSVRSMVSNFGNNALDNLAKAITSSGSLALAGTGTLDQNVHIEASFPNVQSHSEIELALNNLINSASQYVNRR